MPRSLSRSSASSTIPTAPSTIASAGRDDGVGLLSAQHGLGDLRRVGEVADAHLDDLNAGDGDALGHLMGEFAGDDVGRAAQ